MEHEHCATCNGAIYRESPETAWEHDTTDADWQQWEMYAMRQHDAEPDYAPVW